MSIGKSMCCICLWLFTWREDKTQALLLCQKFAQPRICTSCLPASPKIYWHRQQLNVLCLAGAPGVSSGSIAPTSSAQHVHQLLASIPQDLLAQAAAQCVVPCRRSWCFIRQHCTHQLSPARAPAACQHSLRSNGTSSSSIYYALQALPVLHQVVSRPPAQPSTCTSCLPASLRIYWHRQQRSVGLMQGPCCITRPTSGPKRAEG